MIKRTFLLFFNLSGVHWGCVQVLFNYLYIPSVKYIRMQIKIIKVGNIFLSISGTTSTGNGNAANAISNQKNGAKKMPYSIGLLPALLLILT